MIKKGFKNTLAFSLMLWIICNIQTSVNGLNLAHTLRTDNLDSKGRISGGDLAAENQFPYQAGLSIELSGNQFTWCGGSLISRQWILTAAHCVYSVRRTMIKKGLKNTLTLSLMLWILCNIQTSVNGLNLAHTLRTDNLDSQGRIAGGDLAAENQFPYQAGLSIELSGNQFTWCGGSLISRQWILTAAHCVYSVIGVMVYLGSIHRLEPQKTFKLPLSNIHLHHSFNSKTLENDIALLRLPTTVALTSSIHPVTLPKLKSTYSSYTYHEAIASGWGREDDSSSTISNHLRYVIRYTLSNAECQHVYGSSIRSTNICIDTTGGKSTCNGDSGGPLVVHDPSDGLIQIGLTSFGKSSGCTKGHPAVFTRLTSYLDWIFDVSGVGH